MLISFLVHGVSYHSLWRYDLLLDKEMVLEASSQPEQNDMKLYHHTLLACANMFKHAQEYYYESY